MIKQSAERDVKRVHIAEHAVADIGGKAEMLHGLLDVALSKLADFDGRVKSDHLVARYGLHLLRDALLLDLFCCNDPVGHMAAIAPKRVPVEFGKQIVAPQGWRKLLPFVAGRGGMICHKGRHICHTRWA